MRRNNEHASVFLSGISDFLWEGSKDMQRVRGDISYFSFFVCVSASFDWGPTIAQLVDDAYCTHRGLG